MVAPRTPICRSKLVRLRLGDNRPVTAPPALPCDEIPAGELEERLQSGAQRRLSWQRSFATSWVARARPAVTDLRSPRSKSRWLGGRAAGYRSLAVRAAVVTFDVISTTTANSSGPAQRTAATPLPSSPRHDVRTRSLFRFGPGACRCERSLWAHSLLKERHTMPATVAETLMSNWRFLP